MSSVSSTGSFTVNTGSTSSSSSSSASTVSSAPVPGVSDSGGSSNIIRITGLDSGLDVDSIVQKMLVPDQMQIQQVKQNMQLVEWKQQQYNTVINDLKNFQNKYLNLTQPDTDMLSPNNFVAFTETSSDPTVGTATASSGAQQGTYSLTVHNIATSANISGKTLFTQAQLSISNGTVAGFINSSGTTTSFTSQSGQVGTIGIDTNGDGTADAALNISAGETVDQMVSDLNSQIANSSSLNGHLSVSSFSDGTNTYLRFNNLDGSSMKIVNTDTTSNTTATDSLGTGIAGTSIATPSVSTPLTALNSSLETDLYFNIKYNGTTAQVHIDNSSSTSDPNGENGGATIGDLIEAISSATQGQVTAKIDDATGNFVLQDANTGSSSTLEILQNSTSTSGTSGSDSTNAALLTALGLSSTAQTTSSGDYIYSDSPQAAQGQDASVTITPPGGTAMTMSESQNSFTINGMSYNIVGTGTGSGTTDITVNPDVDTVFNNINNFINDYNNIVSEVNTLVTQKRNYDYPPLTDQQMSQMSQTEIDNWNAKSQQGLLQNDTNLTQMLSQMRNAFFDAVNGAGITFNRNILGLDTSDDYTQAGQIQFTAGGQDLLKQALQQNTQAVTNLFTQPSSSTDSTTKYNNEGIFQRLSDIFEQYVGDPESTYNSGILTNMANNQTNYSITGSGAATTFPDQIYQYTVQIQNLTTVMNNDQTKYYAEFSNLESAMQSLNDQSSSLSQLLG